MGPCSVPLQYQHLRFGHSPATAQGFPGLPDPVDILFDALFGKIILFGIKFKIFIYLLNKILSIVEKSVFPKPCELKFAEFLLGWTCSLALI